MSNFFLTPEVVAKEALMCLQGNLVMADLVHRDFGEEFAGMGDTVTVRRPAQFVAKNFDGTTSTQAIHEGSVAVKLNRFRDVTVEVTSKQMSLSIADFSKQVVEPAMAALAQAMDLDLLAEGLENCYLTVDGDPNAGDLADIAALAKHLDVRKAPMTDRALVLHPEHKYRYALAENLSNVSYAGDNQTLRDALLGRVYTLDTYMDQNAPDSNATTPGTATDLMIRGDKGDRTVTVFTNGTVKSGDGFILGGELYRFTGSGENNSAVTIDKPLLEESDDQDAVFVSGPMSLAFHRNALALVTRKLELPMGAGKAAYAESDGLSVRVVYDYDATTKTDKISFDVLYGVKALQPSLLCAIKG